MTPTLKLRKRYYTPTEVAKMFGVSRQTVVAWIKDKRLPAFRTPGGHHRIPASAVQGSDAVEIITPR